MVVGCMEPAAATIPTASNVPGQPNPTYKSLASCSVWFFRFFARRLLGHRSQHPEVVRAYGFRVLASQYTSFATYGASLG